MDLTKHEDWFNPTTVNNTINVIGVGALGSWMAEGLVRMGFDNINLWDDDVVNPHNISNQNYLDDQVGMSKVDKLAERLLAINPNLKVNKNGRYIFDSEKRNYLTGYVFLMLDNIDTRRMIVENNPHVLFWTDIRIGLEDGQMYSATRDKRDYLLSTMQWKQDDPDREVKLSACGRELGILPTIWNIVSLGINNFVIHIKDNENYKTIMTNSLEMKMVAFEQKK